MSIRSFAVTVPQADLDDLHRRLDRTRWPSAETAEGWTQGVPLATMRELVRYWRHDYDWRRCEARLNALPQFQAEIDGQPIHFIHVRSSRADALPLILTHGWPGSVLEFLDVIAPLTEPDTHAAPGAPAFDVVIPSLPGYGFSGAPAAAGMGVERIAALWIALMRELGYGRFVAQGGDWGAAVTTALAMAEPPELLGIHLNMPLAFPTAEDAADATAAELDAMAAMTRYQEVDSGYAKLQSTKPQTIGYALADSPVGQAAWIYEKLRGWTDNDGTVESALARDAVLDTITLYWLTNSGASSGRLYWESMGAFKSAPLSLPVGVSVFPHELFRPSRRWAERVYSNIVHWSEPGRGGHFAAWEQPARFVADLRASFAGLAGPRTPDAPNAGQPIR